MPKRGLEPLQLSPLPPQGSASTNSATWACSNLTFLLVLLCVFCRFLDGFRRCRLGIFRRGARYGNRCRSGCRWIGFRRSCCWRRLWHIACWRGGGSGRCRCGRAPHDTEIFGRTLLRTGLGMVDRHAETQQEKQACQYRRAARHEVGRALCAENRCRSASTKTGTGCGTRATLEQDEDGHRNRDDDVKNRSNYGQH